MISNCNRKYHFSHRSTVNKTRCPLLTYISVVFAARRGEPKRTNNKRGRWRDFSTNWRHDRDMKRLLSSAPSPNPSLPSLFPSDAALYPLNVSRFLRSRTRNESFALRAQGAKSNDLIIPAELAGACRDPCVLSFLWHALGTR